MTSSFVQTLCKLTTCNKTPKNTCSRCKVARYCSKECQTEHWIHHKTHCSAIESKMFIHVPENILTGIMNGNKLVSFTCSSGEVKEEVILRLDGYLYTKNSGIRVLTIDKEMRDVVHKMYTSRSKTHNWDKYTKLYGQPTKLNEELYAFISKEEKKLIVLVKQQDTIKEVVDLSTMLNSSNINLDNITIEPVLATNDKILIRLGNKG